MMQSHFAHSFRPTHFAHSFKLIYALMIYRPLGHMLSNVTSNAVDVSTSAASLSFDQAAQLRSSYVTLEQCMRLASLLPAHH